MALDPPEAGVEEGEPLEGFVHGILGLVDQFLGGHLGFSDGKGVIEGKKKINIYRVSLNRCNLYEDIGKGNGGRLLTKLINHISFTVIVRLFHIKHRARR